MPMIRKIYKIADDPHNIFADRCHFFQSHGTFQPIKHQEGVSWRVGQDEVDVKITDYSAPS